MVHSGIEYVMMASYAKDLNVQRHANAGKQKNCVDAEPTLLRGPHARYERFSSRGEDDFADKVLCALRYQFSSREGKAAPRKELA
jgi:6-phosphogluconate dehydrogenase (decarboxylating)